MPVLCNYTGALHVVAYVQVLYAPVYPGCGRHICGLVRHGCVQSVQKKMTRGSLSVVEKAIYDA